MAGSATYLDAVEARRTHYALAAESTLSDEELLEVVQKAVKHTPTAFNSQSARAVLVLGDKHRQLWDVIFEGYRQMLADDSSRIDRNRKRFETAFRAGYGTIVVLEDTQRVDEFSQKSPEYTKASVLCRRARAWRLTIQLFPIWSQNSTGMLQHVIWTALAAEGLGASLQHYGQVSDAIETSIREVLQVPAHWVSTALIPFGKPTGPPGGSWDKSFEPIEERVKRIT